MTSESDDWAGSAHEAGTTDELGSWVHAFLCSPGSDNTELADLLAGRMSSWHGPVPLPIDLLDRLAGPRDAPALVAVEDHEWRDDVQELERRLADGWQPAPVIVTFREGRFALEDGNHRVEGLRRARRRETWAVVGFEDEADREEFLARHVSAPTRSP